MNFKPLIILSLLTALLLFSCKNKIKEYSDFDKPLNLKNGEEFILKIKANHSTAYEWFEKSPIDTHFLDLKLIDYKTDNPKQDGSPGYEYWYFKALKTGETSVQLYYTRKFEEDNIDSLNIHIKITD